jgi:hypothetical protein
LVSVALIANGLLDIWFSYREQRALLVRIQAEQAAAAAARISHFVTEIEGQMGWTTQMAWNPWDIQQRRLEALRLLRQVPAITELSLLDASGREQLKVSRLAMDIVGVGSIGRENRHSLQRWCGRSSMARYISASSRNRT